MESKIIILEINTKKIRETRENSPTSLRQTLGQIDPCMGRYHGNRLTYRPRSTLVLGKISNLHFNIKECNV